jgi:hypothetical protein
MCFNEMLTSRQNSIDSQGSVEVRKDLEHVQWDIQTPDGITNDVRSFSECVYMRQSLGHGY